VSAGRAPRTESWADGCAARRRRLGFGLGPCARAHVSLVFDDGGFPEDATFLLALHWHPNADTWQ
jgi:hypothetical protein